MSCTRDCGRARRVPRKKEIRKVRILSIRPRADIFDACGAGSRRAALAHARGEGVPPRGVRVRVRVVRVGFWRCPRGAPVRTAAAALRRVEPRVDLREAAVAVDAAVIAAAAAVGGGARGGAQERDDGRVRVSVRRGKQVVLLLGAALARGAEEGRLRGGGGYGGGRGGGGVHGRGGAEGRARERAALVRELLRARARVGALEEAALVAELERR